MCTSEQVVNETVNKLYDTLEKAYYKKYKDLERRKAILRTIDVRRNEGIKKQDYNYVKKNVKNMNGV